jgi:hypothetical protein
MRAMGNMAQNANMRVQSTKVNGDEMRLDIENKHVSWGSWSKKIMLSFTLASTILMIVGMSLLASGSWGSSETTSALVYDSELNTHIHQHTHSDAQVHLPAAALSVWYQVVIYTFASLILMHQLTLSKRMWDQKLKWLNPATFHLHLGAQDNTVQFCVAALFFILFPVMHSQTETTDHFVSVRDYAIRNGNDTHSVNGSHVYIDNTKCTNRMDNFSATGAPQAWIPNRIVCPTCSDDFEHCYSSQTDTINYISSNHKLGNGLILVVVGIIIALLSVPLSRFAHDFQIKREFYHLLPKVLAGRRAEQEKEAAEAGSNSYKTGSVMQKREQQMFAAIEQNNENDIVRAAGLRA